jgi:hypothetical protein
VLVRAALLAIRTGQSRRLSWGLFPFSVFGRRCAVRGCHRPERSRSGVADGRSRRPNCVQSKPNPRVPSAHSYGFPPGVTGSDVWFPSAFACSPPAAGHSPERPFQPGVPVLARQVCAAWPALHSAGSAPGIQPFAALLRPDSSATSSAAKAHLTFACRILLDDFSRGIGRQNSCKTDCGRSECAKCVFWALTRPASRPLPVVRQRAHAALGFASFGLADTWWRSLAGSSPPSLIGRRPFRFRRLSALGLWRRSPALPGPRWSPDQNRPRRLLFSDSSGQCLALPAAALPVAGRASRMRFSTCRQDFDALA